MCKKANDVVEQNENCFVFFMHHVLENWLHANIRK